MKGAVGRLDTAADIQPSISDMSDRKRSVGQPVHPYFKLTGFFLTGGGKSSDTAAAAVAVAAAGDSMTEAVVFCETGGGVGVTVVAV